MPRNYQHAGRVANVPRQQSSPLIPDPLALDSRWFNRSFARFSETRTLETRACRPTSPSPGVSPILSSRPVSPSLYPALKISPHHCSLLPNLSLLCLSVCLSLAPALTHLDPTERHGVHQSVGVHAQKLGGAPVLRPCRQTKIDPSASHNAKKIGTQMIKIFPRQTREIKAVVPHPLAAAVGSSKRSERNKVFIFQQKQSRLRPKQS